jgi:transposase
VSAYLEADTKEAGARRRRWSLEVKRQLVAETLEPGSSVSIVARRHDVNANQLFKWRHELASTTRADAKLVPVAVVEESATPPALPPASPVRVTPTPARIEIVIAGGVKVRIEGAADPAAVTAVVAAVMKARRRR